MFSIQELFAVPTVNLFSVKLSDFTLWRQIVLRLPVAVPCSKKQGDIRDVSSFGNGTNRMVLRNQFRLKHLLLKVVFYVFKICHQKGM